MKYTLLCLFAFSLLLETSCQKILQAPPQPPLIGVFSGQFLFVHRRLTVLPYDTVKANVVLTLQGTPSNTFAVTGDTTQHAGSHGSFTLFSGVIFFNDVTYPQNGTKPAKLHLSGSYEYYYDGTNLQMLGASADTAVFEYVLKKN